ncbi:hypothetical protein COY24_03515 [Candidatus Uhrbacteria bacterium CG_4_10_14_0_2_um_filter_41_21]|nr:MAG: hypothetical protein COY24_03515 [Candidatus Uhrbacteria bacterium CG_4_10_14_0_2_um_filter_41_21]
MFENQNEVISKTPTPSQEDIESALELISEDEVLKSNPRVLKLVETGFITEDGRQLDPGNFLTAVKEALANEPLIEEKTEMYEDRVNRIMNAMVVHSNSTR